MRFLSTKRNSDPLLLQHHNRHKREPNQMSQSVPSPALGPRVRSLVASVFIAIASGTSYVYSVYAPQLVKHAGLTGTEAANLSLALSLGGSLGGLPAGLIIDKIGPQWSSAIGGFFCFVSFYTLHWAYENSVQGVAVYMFALALCGVSSVLAFYSTVKTATTNFPHHRGSAGALPVSSYALASLLYSSISVRFFDGDTGGLLRFFSIAPPLTCLACAYFLQIAERPKKRRTSSVISERDTLIQPPSHSASVLSLSSMLGQNPNRKNSFHHMFSLWGIRRTPSTLSLDQTRPVLKLPDAVREHRGSDSSAIYVPVEDVPVFVKEGSPIWDHHIFKAIRTRIFVKFYFILACLMGIGQMYIYSVGYIVVALAHSNPESPHPVGDSQALQVSAIALFSFLGRLTSGPISDVVRRKFRAQRIWCIVFSALLMGLGQNLVTYMDDVDALIVPSVVIGFSFGFCFGTFPAIVADTFGTDGFTTLWGIMSTSGVVVLMTLCNYLAATLKAHSDDEGVCTLGAACYKETFVLTQWMCLVVAGMTVFTIWYNNRVAQSLATT